MDPTQLSPVLRLLGPQGDPPNQPLPFNIFFSPLSLPLKVIKIQEWVQIGTLGILLPVVVVFKVTARDLGTEAVVEGTVRPFQGSQGGAVTLNQGNRVLLMYPLVGMEATQAIAGDRGMVQSIVLGAILHFQALSESVPSAMLLFDNLILMRAVGIVHSVSNWV